MRMHKDKNSDTLKYNTSIIQYLPENKWSNVVEQAAIIDNILLVGDATEGQIEIGETPKMALEELIKNYEMFKEINAISAVSQYNDKRLRVVVGLHLDWFTLPIHKNIYNVYVKIPISDIMNIPEIKKIIEIAEYYDFFPHNLTPHPATDNLFSDYSNYNLPLKNINVSITMWKYKPLTPEYIENRYQSIKNSLFNWKQ